MIVVGDIHGCHGEMVSVLERCGYRLGNPEDKERFSVVLAGDLVNKGPKNAEVIKTAREEGFLAVRGNHDNFALAAATGTGRFSKNFASKKGEGGAKPPSWVKQLSRCVGFVVLNKVCGVYPGTGNLSRIRLGSRGNDRGVGGAFPLSASKIQNSTILGLRCGLTASLLPACSVFESRSSGGRDPPSSSPVW